MRFPVDRPAAGVHVDLTELEEARPLPEVSAHPEEQDDWKGQVHLEETFGIVGWLAIETSNGPDSNVKLLDGQHGAKIKRRTQPTTDLSNENQDDHDNTGPRAPDTESRLEWDLVESATVVFPGSAEADMGHTDLQITVSYSATSDAEGCLHCPK